MFAQDKAHDILGIHTAQITKHLVKAGSIQQGSGTHDAAGRIIVFPLEVVGQNIEGIRDHDDDRLDRKSVV